jgi:catechol 2,3-dioxygenase-like lactoylglutathione lyase family enzyme
MRTVLFFAVPLAAAVIVVSTSRAVAPADFPRTTIDIGVHVSDVEAAADFYTNAIGLTEIEGFTVDADFATAAGLTDRQPLAVRVFVLGRGDSATRLKLMQIPGVEAVQDDNAYVHSQLGFRYLTIFVDDANDALRRLRAAGHEPAADGPALIGVDPAGDYLTVVRDPDGNLIELIGPMG